MAFGVSNSFKRGVVRTYSRQRAFVTSGYDDERPHKKIRMGDTGSIVEEKFGGYREKSVFPEDTLNGERATLPEKTRSEESQPSSVSASSSPHSAGHAVFSDPAQEDESELSSLPSSPPPPPSPLLKARKPAFSFLKRKSSTLDEGAAGGPLSDITHNARKIPRSGKKSLTQTRIDLGGDVRKTCRTCGMEYIPSVKEDSLLHSKFCAMNVGGVDMGKGFLRDDSVKRIHSERAGRKEKEMVVMVNRKSSLAAKNAVRKALEVVNAELSSADIDESQLWETLHDGEKRSDARKQTRKGSIHKSNRQFDRFKAFLYMVEERCVGFCLVEKISQAFPVVQLKQLDGQASEVVAGPRSSSISVATTADVALLGISRIWTSKSHRGQGLAVDLLDCGKNNFFYGVAAPKSLIAFSQPTESGGQLAKRWFEAKAGWHIYRGT